MTSRIWNRGQIFGGGGSFRSGVQPPTGSGPTGSAQPNRLSSPRPAKNDRLRNDRNDRKGGGVALSDFAGDVFFCLGVAGAGEDVRRAANLQQLAQVEIRRALRNARRLLHGVRHHHNRVVGAQLVY